MYLGNWCIVKGKVLLSTHEWKGRIMMIRIVGWCTRCGCDDIMKFIVKVQLSSFSYFPDYTTTKLITWSYTPCTLSTLRGIHIHTHTKSLCHIIISTHPSKCLVSCHYRISKSASANSVLLLELLYLDQVSNDVEWFLLHFIVLYFHTNFVPHQCTILLINFRFLIFYSWLFVYGFRV